MQPRLQLLPEKILVGQRLTMSIVKNETAALWRRFKPRHKEIENRIGSSFFSVEIYPKEYFSRFDPNALFEKWAAVEVADYSFIPEGMQVLKFPSGLYAIFFYKGSFARGQEIYQYIFTSWLPNSEFAADDRPHFSIMGKNYKVDDSNSEEEIWIPLCKKNKATV